MTLQSKIWSGGGEQFPAFLTKGAHKLIRMICIIFSITILLNSFNTFSSSILSNKTFENISNTISHDVGGHHLDQEDSQDKKRNLLEKIIYDQENLIKAQQQRILELENLLQQKD